MNLKYITYFSIAAGTVISSQPTAPTTPWDWVKLSVGSLVAGFIAIRALDSMPPTAAAQPTKQETLPPSLVESPSTPSPNATTSSLQ
jgi:hypothetical protein